MNAWMTTREAMEYTGYARETLCRYCREGRLRHSRSGMRAAYRFRREWLDAMISAASPTAAVDRPLDLPGQDDDFDRRASLALQRHGSQHH